MDAKLQAGRQRGGALTADQIDWVRASWTLLQPDADAVATRFYDTLFVVAPQLRALFKRDMQTQGAMLMAMLAAIVEGLENLEPLLPSARQLAVRHVAWGVKAAHYDSVGAALLLTLEHSLGPHFTPALRQAWAGAYNALAAAMKEAAYPAQPAAQLPGGE